MNAISHKLAITVVPLPPLRKIKGIYRHFFNSRKIIVGFRNTHGGAASGPYSGVSVRVSCFFIQSPYLPTYKDNEDEIAN